MTNEEKYVVEKFKEFKLKKRGEMIKALVASGYECNEIAVVFNLQESVVRSLSANSDNKSGQNTNE